MSGKIDYFDSVTNDGVYPITATTNRWTSETFTATTSYSCSSIELPLSVNQVDSGIVLSIRLYAVDVNRKPTGSVLASGTISGSSITTSLTWINCTFSTVYNIVASTEYAIVCYCTVANSKTITWWGKLTANVYAGKCWYDGNATPTWTESTVSDVAFRTYTGYPVGIVYNKKLVTIGNNEVWYESAIGTMSELTDANGTINTSARLSAIEAYQKVFIVNETNLKIADFINTKLTTADIKPTGKVIPLKGTLLTGGTSGAQMIVDYIDASDGSCNVYGYKITTVSFISEESVTGTVTSSNDVTFTLSVAEDAPPHWYNWTVYSADVTTYGIMPTSSSLIALYRGRLVFNDDNRPHAWYMTKVGSPWKILYDYTNDGDLSAVTHTNTRVGEIGDIITAIIVYKDDFIIFGCVDSVWILIGDPLGSGQLARVTNATGVWGAKSWCIDDKSNLYFLGNDGIYRMPISESYSTPDNISKMPLPNLIATLDLDKSLHRITLGFDPIKNGILISKTLLSDGTNTSYWFDLTTQGFYPESYPASCGIFSIYYYPATDDTYKKFLVGCTDGYIREFDNSTKNDTTTASTSVIDSYFTVIQRLGTDQNTEGKMIWINGVTAGGTAGGTFGDTDSVGYALYTGKDAELVLEDIKDDTTYVNAMSTGTWSGTGKQTKDRSRIKGCWFGLLIRNSTASETYGINDIYCVIAPAGKLQS